MLLETDACSRIYLSIIYADFVTIKEILDRYQNRDFPAVLNKRRISVTRPARGTERYFFEIMTERKSFAVKLFSFLSF